MPNAEQDVIIRSYWSMARTILAFVLIAFGILVAVLDIGVRALASFATDIKPPDPTVFMPQQYADNELVQLFDKYDAVFIGSVKGFNQVKISGLLLVAEFTKFEYEMSATNTYKPPAVWDETLPGVVFDVERVWKGVRQSQVAMPIGFMDSDNYCWGRHFDGGKRYIVYARLNTYASEPPYLSTSLCDPTAAFPYTFDPSHTYYDLPKGIPDLDLSVVGSGNVPTEQVNLLRIDIPWVLVIAGVLVLIGRLLLLWPKFTEPKSVT